LCLRCGHYIDPESDVRAVAVLVAKLPWSDVPPGVRGIDIDAHRPAESAILADLEAYEIALRARFLVLVGRPWYGTFEQVCRYWDCNYGPAAAAYEESNK
jgi:hypothetical protein